MARAASTLQVVTHDEALLVTREVDAQRRWRGGAEWVRSNGDVVWSAETSFERTRDNDVTSNRVFLVGWQGDSALVALDRATGKIVWQKGAPLLDATCGLATDGDTLVVWYQAERGVRITAYDVFDGRERWSGAVATRNVHAACVFRTPGRLLVNGRHACIEMDARTGDTLRELPYSEMRSTPSGVFLDDREHLVWLRPGGGDPRALEPGCHAYWAHVRDGDPVVLDSEGVLHRYDGSSGRARWTLDLSGKWPRTPHTRDLSLPARVAFLRPVSERNQSLLWVDLDEGRIVQQRFVGESMFVALDGGRQVTMHNTDGGVRHISALDATTGDPSRTTEVSVDGRLVSERFECGRFWITGTAVREPAAPGARAVIDLAVFDPFTGHLACRRGEITVKAT